MTRNQLYLPGATAATGLILPVSPLASDGLSGFTLTSVSGPPVALAWSADGAAWTDLTLPHTLAPGLLRLIRTDESATASCLNGHYTDADGALPLPAADEVLARGILSPSVALTDGQYRSYSVDVPAGALNLNFFHEDSTNFLYVRQGALPTRTASDLRPSGGGNSINVPNPPVTGRWYATWQAFGNRSNRLRVSWAEAVANGFSRVIASTDPELQFYVPRPAGATTLTAKTTGGTGKLLLGAGLPGEGPTFAPNTGTTEQTLTLSNPPAGEYIVVPYVTDSTGFAGVTLTVTWS